jgi:hypothetical protein
MPEHRNGPSGIIANDNSWDSFAHALPDMISIDQAARSFIDKVGQANTFVQKIDFLWDDEKPCTRRTFNKASSTLSRSMPMAASTRNGMSHRR